VSRQRIRIGRNKWGLHSPRPEYPIFDRNELVGYVRGRVTEATWSRSRTSYYWVEDLDGAPVSGSFRFLADAKVAARAWATQEVHG
jgi:hypothetical protein